MGTVTKTVGTSSRQYSTLATAYASVPANLVTDGNSYVLELYNDTEFTAGVSISGNTTDSTHTLTIKCASGQSFRDNASVQTNRLWYDQANGVAVKDNGYGSPVLSSSVANTFIKDLQIRNTNSGQAPAYSGGGIIQNCILIGKHTGGNKVVYIAGGSANQLLNCLVVVDSSNGEQGVDVSSGSTMVNCTLVRPSNQTAGGRPIHAAYGTSLVRNCLIFGFTTAADGTYSTDGHNCSDQSSIPGSTGNLTSKTYANQFVNSSSASTPDFRLKSGSDAIDAGVTDTTDIPSGDDIAKTSRPSGVSWDIGAWEFVVSGGIINNKTLTATLSSAASISRSIGAIRTVSQSSVASIIKSVGATKSTTQSNSPKAVKGIGVTKNATQSCTSSVQRQVGVFRSVVLVTTTVIAKAVNVIRSAIQSSSASLTKSIGKKLSATSALVASIVAIKVKILILTATLAGSSVLSKSINAVRSSQLLGNPKVVRSIAMTRAAAFSLIGRSSKLIGKSIAVSLGLFGLVLTSVIAAVGALLPNKKYTYTGEVRTRTIAGIKKIRVYLGKSRDRKL